MRSKLFVPASRPELFAKGLASQADALSFDLEDAVAEGRKKEARQALHDFLRAGLPPEGGKTIIVRVNAQDTPHFQEDVAAIALPGVHLLNLPKPRDAQDVQAAAQALEAAERANGVTQPIGILVNIETARTLRIAHELAAAHPRVAGLQLGLGDLFEPLDINRRHGGAVRHAMLAVRLAAGEAGVFAYDSAFADVRDEAGFTAEAREARDLGFIGKSCIHPSQVVLANAAFQPGPEEIAHALRVLEAARAAEASGTGAYMVDGRMVDAPFVRRAQAVAALAAKLDLLPR